MPLEYYQKKEKYLMDLDYVINEIQNEFYL